MSTMPQQVRPSSRTVVYPHMPIHTSTRRTMLIGTRWGYN